MVWLLVRVHKAESRLSVQQYSIVLSVFSNFGAKSKHGFHKFSHGYINCNLDMNMKTQLIYITFRHFDLV